MALLAHLDATHVSAPYGFMALVRRTYGSVECMIETPRRVGDLSEIKAQMQLTRGEADESIAEPTRVCALLISSGFDARGDGSPQGLSRALLEWAYHRFSPWREGSVEALDVFLSGREPAELVKRIESHLPAS